MVTLLTTDHAGCNSSMEWELLRHSLSLVSLGMNILHSVVWSPYCRLQIDCFTCSIIYWSSTLCIVTRVFFVLSPGLEPIDIKA